MTIAIHGTVPARLPNTNGVQLTCAPGREVVSINQPNRIIEALTPNRAMSAAMSVIPVMPAMSTIISDAERLYSTHRNRLRCAASSRR